MVGEAYNPILFHPVRLLRKMMINDVSIAENKIYYHPQANTECIDLEQILSKLLGSKACKMHFSDRKY